MSESLLNADSLCFGSVDCFSDETLEGADMGVCGGASVSAGVDTSGMDVEFCSWWEVTVDVSGVAAGETAVVAPVLSPTDTGVAVVSDTWEVRSVVATVTDCSWVDVDVVTVINGAVVASVHADTGDGMFFVIVGGVVEVEMCFSGVVTLTPSVGVDEITSPVFVSPVAVTLEDTVAGAAAQVGAGDAAAETPASVVTCACVDT